MEDLQPIHQQTELDAFCSEASTQDWLVLDTEFMRVKNYYPQLCLIQVATQDRVTCIDPLGPLDLDPLFNLINNNSIIKVFHSAGQDLEVLNQYSGQIPQPIFDTQIAAMLTGASDQIGYAALVEEMLNVKLTKSQTRTDWTKRPLSRPQLAYAVDDVRYLREIFLRQIDTLETLGRRSWLVEECTAAVQPNRFFNQPDKLLSKVKGARNLSGREQATVRQLAVLRESIAQQKNLPRKWVLPDQALLDLAQSHANHVDDLASISSLSSRQISTFGEKILGQLKSARSCPETEWPKHTPPGSLPPTQTQAIKLIQKLLREISQQHNLSPTLLASRKELEHLVQGETDIRLLQGWRYQLAGRAVERLLGTIRTQD